MIPLISLDIETECAVDGCSETDCRHALDSYRNRITVMAAYTMINNCPQADIFNNIQELQGYLHKFLQTGFQLTGFNLKWDLKVLTHKCPDLNYLYDHWNDDVQIMATAYTRKVTPEYMYWYSNRRKELNKQGAKHRDAKEHSLKVCAPFFLGVEPFWETNDHNNVDYVTKDAKYTYELHQFFETKLKEEGSYSFYKEKFLKWNKFLSKVEHRGIAIDLPLIDKLDSEAKTTAVAIENNLDQYWTPGYSEYFKLGADKLRAKYQGMYQIALSKAPHREDKLKTKYEQMAKKATDKHYENVKFNLGSPTQLKWLLKDYLKLDITDFEQEESTGIEVLQRLADNGRKDIADFIKWRGLTKLTQAFFPSYREMQVNGRLYPSFHPFVVRTGRLSSSNVNLQQVPGDLHKLFIAGPGRKLITRDMSAIEPRLIAYYTQDKTLCDLIMSGQDFHGYNTKILCELDCDVSEVKRSYKPHRELGKEAGLSILYGAGANRLQAIAQSRGFQWSLGDCRYKVDQLRKGYPQIQEFKDALNQLLVDEPMTNLFGRMYRIQDPDDIYMQGFNTLIQGSGSDMVLNSASKTQLEYDSLGLDAHVVLLVHDEIVVDSAESCVKQAEEILEKNMTNYDLTTKHGKINLLVEGKTSNVWEK